MSCEKNAGDGFLATLGSESSLRQVLVGAVVLSTASAWLVKKKYQRKMPIQHHQRDRLPPQPLMVAPQWRMCWMIRSIEWRLAWGLFGKRQHINWRLHSGHISWSYKLAISNLLLFTGFCAHDSTNGCDFCFPFCFKNRFVSKSKVQNRYHYHSIRVV